MLPIKIMILWGYVDKVYDEYIEIISLDSFVENKGIGSHLLNYAEIIASDMSKRSIRVITTNENISILYYFI